jgi:hypothetical protein
VLLAWITWLLLVALLALLGQTLVAAVVVVDSFLVQRMPLLLEILPLLLLAQEAHRQELMVVIRLFIL